jgi:CRP-like cAMP-binding protein
MRRFTAAIAALELAQPLPDDAREYLAARAQLRVYGPGEAIVRQGEASQELFIIETGLVGVEVRSERAEREGRQDRDEAPAAPSKAREVAELGPGQCFGEMGLLTGEKRAATVRAKKICRLVVVDHDSFHGVLASHPEVVERMGVLLASRQAALDAAAASHAAAAAPEERSRRFISQIREFFKLV